MKMHNVLAVVFVAFLAGMLSGCWGGGELGPKCRDAEAAANEARTACGGTTVTLSCSAFDLLDEIGSCPAAEDWFDCVAAEVDCVDNQYIDPTAECGAQPDTIDC